MATFPSHFLTPLRQIPSSLFLVFVLIIIIIHPSSADDHEDEPVRGEELLTQICKNTTDNKFCANTMFKQVSDAPWWTASDIADAALRRALGVASEAQVAIAGLLQNSSSSNQQRDRQILQRCQLDNEKAVTELSAASNDMNSDSFDSVVEDLNTASNATKNCQDIIQGTPFSALLTQKNIDVIRLCEISVVSTNFFTIDDWT